MRQRRIKAVSIVRKFMNNYGVNDKKRNFFIFKQAVDDNDRGKITFKMIGNSPAGGRLLFFDTPKLPPRAPAPFDFNLIGCLKIGKIFAINIFKSIFQPFLVSHAIIITEKENRKNP